MISLMSDPAVACARNSLCTDSVGKDCPAGAIDDVYCDGNSLFAPNWEAIWSLWPHGWAWIDLARNDLARNDLARTAATHVIFF